MGDQVWLSPDAGRGLSRRQALALGLGGTAAWASGISTAAGQGTPQPPSKPTGQVIVGLSQEPTVFNPLMPHIEVDQGVHFNLFSPLWGVDEKGNFFPQLATEIPTVENGGISEDGLDWRIKLRPDVKWHDGEPFSADDVKFTLDLINNKNFRALNRAGHELVGDIKVVSPTEITWHMQKAFAPYPSILSWTFIVPAHILGKAADPNTAPFNNAPVGTGPFRWSERMPGDHVTLVANEHFFGTGPYLERVVFRYIPDLTVLFTQFQTGAVDYTGIQGITADHYNEAIKIPGRKVVPGPAAFVESITMNQGKPVFQDPAVRQALYYGMDKKSIIDAIYYGLPTETETYLPRESWAFNPDLPKHAYDPAKAKQILDAAGWKPGAGGIREKNGLRLAFSNSTTAGNHVREQAQELLQQNWRDIGADMQIKNMPAAVIWGDYYNLSQYDSVMVGQDEMTGPDPDVTTYYSSKAIPVKGGAGQNTMQYANPKVDELLAQGASTLDQKKRAAIYREMEAIIRDDLPMLPIFQYARIEGTKDKLIGYTPSVYVSSNCWNIGQWYWAS
ncbi:MAG TPA: peptide ABC transporter substrate-binding protein [Acetobacteraceae bacterium]